MLLFTIIGPDLNGRVCHDVRGPLINILPKLSAKNSGQGYVKL